jgi:hypothetical protein
MLSSSDTNNEFKSLDAIDTPFVMSYNSNDFFYNKVTPPIDCSTLLKKELTCTDSHNISTDCINQALCINQQRAQQLIDLEKTNHGVDIKYNDDNSIYQNTLLNTANLGIGIILISSIIYKTIYPTLLK